MKVLLFILSLAFIVVSCDSSIENGYTDKTSYASHDSISIFLNAKKEVKNYQIDITDINGNFLESVTADIFRQNVNPDKPYQNGFGYKRTVKIPVPKFESGVYLFDKKIPFVIRPSIQCDILILYSSNTENAYCNSGGKSIYDYNSSDTKAAEIVSFLRPIETPFHSTDFLKWIVKQKQYKIGYICDKDMDEYENIASAKVLIIPGHSEYWTRKARANFDRFVDEGKNALIISGNTMWWQVRYNESENQMICYKNGETDSIEDEKLKTINWPDSILDFSVMNSIGLDFNHGGYGKNEDKGWDGYKIVNPSSPLLKGSGLEMNDIIKLPTDEYDGGKLVFSLDSSTVTIANPFDFYRYELIGYDLGSRLKDSNGAFIIMQKTEKSGVVINTGSTDWCKKAGMLGKDSKVIKGITLNMIDLLLEKNTDNLFTSKPKR